jgi:hypothetical protein
MQLFQLKHAIPERVWDIAYCSHNVESIRRGIDSPAFLYSHWRTGSREAS